MSVDDRLRSALAQQAEMHVSRVEEALDGVRARGRRDRWRTFGVVVAAAVVVVVGSVMTVDRLGPLPTPKPAAPAPSTPYDAETRALRGTLAADVSRPAVLRGNWVLRLNGNGTIDATAPPGSGRTADGAVFTADGSSFRTSLFGRDVCRGDGTGIYTWLRAGDRLEFTTLSDNCRARELFLTDTSWSVSTGPSARG